MEEMRTETNWEHYEYEILELFKSKIGDRNSLSHLECAVREIMYKKGNLGCAQYDNCYECREDVYAWLKNKITLPKMLKNGDSLTVGQHILVSECGTYEDSFTVRFLTYSNGLFYTIPVGNNIKSSGHYGVYKYAWPCLSHSNS